MEIDVSFINKTDIQPDVVLVGLGHRKRRAMQPDAEPQDDSAAAGSESTDAIDAEEIECECDWECVCDWNCDCDCWVWECDC